MIHPEAYRFSRCARGPLEPLERRGHRREEPRVGRATAPGYVKRTARALGAATVLIGGAFVVPRTLSRESGSIASISGEATYQDPTLLADAFALPVAAAYARGGLDSQKNSSFCGPATAADVARSLGGRSGQVDVLDGTGIRAPLGILWRGVTLDEEARIVAHATRRRVTVLRDLDLAAFRAEIAHANDAGRRYAVNFSRSLLFGRGGGHHSPIGGYLADRDLVLVLDVNGKYGPWLVPTERLFRAVDTVDRATGRKRGLLRVE